MNAPHRLSNQRRHAEHFKIFQPRRRRVERHGIGDKDFIDGRRFKPLDGRPEKTPCVAPAIMRPAPRSFISLAPPAMVPAVEIMSSTITIFRPRRANHFFAEDFMTAHAAFMNDRQFRPSEVAYREAVFHVAHIRRHDGQIRHRFCFKYFTQHRLGRQMIHGDIEKP